MVTGIEPRRNAFSRRAPGKQVAEQVVAANLDQVVSSDMLLTRGWSDTDLASPSYLWVSIRRLRSKIELDPDRPVHLLTVRGVGYRLATAPIDRAQAEVAGADGYVLKPFRADAFADSVVELIALSSVAPS